MAKAFWVMAPFKGSIAPGDLDESVEQNTGEPRVRIKTLYSGISRGTESLVFSGQVPESEYQSMRAPFQEGEFPFPVKYGYASVGQVESGPSDLVGRSVFCLYPHQDTYSVPALSVVLLPDNLPPGRAVLAANMETAVNGVWDALPRLGERVAVVGLGVVGCLVAWLINQIPGTRVIALDVNPKRREIAEALGLEFATSTKLDDRDLVIHASGHPSGLETALSLCANEARVIEMSWYGEQAVPAPLGRAFHSKRLTLRSSQVGQLHPDQRPRWTHRDRMELALNLLRAPELDQLITGESHFDQLPDVMASLSGQENSPELPTASDTLCHRIVY